MNKKEILNKIEFIRDECIQPDEFMVNCDKGRRAIVNFENRIGTCIKVMNLEKEDIDFFWHVYKLNWDNLNKETLTEENIIIPKEKEFLVNTKVLVNTSSYEYYEKKYDLFSEASYYYDVYHGWIDVNEGDMYDEDSREYEIIEWEANFEETNKSVNESNITNEIKLKKLLKMKEIIENKINEYRQL